uniref:Uncharacterized protein n=1 Tax=Arundo donax TaxID=35708 RepID=A0A0A8ZID4_ARUDO
MANAPHSWISHWQRPSARTCSLSPAPQ